MMASPWNKTRSGGGGADAIPGPESVRIGGGKMSGGGREDAWVPLSHGGVIRVVTGAETGVAVDRIEDLNLFFPDVSR